MGSCMTWRCTVIGAYLCLCGIYRVQQCKLTTLETRRVRGDQIEVFKMTHRIEGLDSGMFFKYRTDNGTQGHSWGLAKECCKLDIRKYAFSQRTINEWNRLPGECVNATSVKYVQE